MTADTDGSPAAASPRRVTFAVGYQLRRAHTQFTAHWLLCFRTAGVPITPVQGGMLIQISEKPGLTQIELARAMSVEGPTLLHSINRLQSLGYLTRQRLPRDRRAHALNLTAEGRRALDIVMHLLPAHEAELLDPLSAVERTHFLGCLRRLTAHGEIVLRRAHAAERESAMPDEPGED